ncbi:hypothetical protein [Dyadobacter jiangsuensis]|uniref:Uncharacterized protein n=1 Tax=Dyadobacter jiangsuensis TaxID=1591085 RepID=A0A2P8F7G9_9BACT|nr:hypothetical protein [Dyadobacter jiangsuensis]PSL17647.1 hypothetical protein CLV60_1366 [Dyadobacter jiangsuensis]
MIKGAGDKLLDQLAARLHLEQQGKARFMQNSKFLQKAYYRAAKQIGLKR